MEIRIVIFLAFVSVTVVANTMVILFAYRFFARMTTSMTAAMDEFRSSSEMRQYVDSMQVAAERAVAVTESTKAKMAEFEPVLNRAEDNYRRTLVDVNGKLERVEDKVKTVSVAVREAVAKPATSIAIFTAGVKRMMEEREAPEDPEDEE